MKDRTVSMIEPKLGTTIEMISSDSVAPDVHLVKRMMPSGDTSPNDRASAWCEWYGSSGESSILAYIRAMNNTTEADMDILQDTMVTAYRNVESGAYEPMTGIPFTGYVKGIARNKMREARRKRRREVALDDVVQNKLTCNNFRPEIVYERQEDSNLLHTSLTKLTYHRRCVLEGDLRGESTTEIADTLGISEESVRQHRSRGLRSLRKMQLAA